MQKRCFNVLFSQDGALVVAEARDRDGSFLGIVSEPSRESAIKELKKIVLDLLVEFAEDGKDPLAALSDQCNDNCIELSLPEIFPVFLRYKRVKHGLTQTDIASLLGTKQQVYARLERPGRANPTISTIECLSRALQEDLLSIA